MDKYRMIDDIAQNLSVNIIRARCIKHEQGWHEHKTKFCYTMWNIIDGTVHIKINNKEFTVSAGDVVVFYPDDTYDAYTNDSGCTFLFCRFSVCMGNKIDILSSINLAGIIPAAEISKKCSAFCKKFSVLYTTAQRVPFKLYALFISYLSDILDVWKKDKCVPFYSEKTNRSTALMADIMEYIDDNFLKDISMKQLCKLAGMSEKHFITSFKASIGISPGKYIVQCRMRLAAELLLETDKKITEIAEIIGYANPYTFSNTFKKYYEESPDNFRKRFVY